MKSLDGQKLLQIWQWGPPAQAEHTIDEAIALCAAFNASGVLVKALDGAAWMGDFDGEPEALRSVDDARRQADACHAAGLYYGVWTNPRGLDVPEESRLTGELARVTEIDWLFLDAEPYPQFWGAWRPVGLASDFMGRIRALAPDAYLVLQPDPRPARFAELRPEEWVPHVDALSGQHYFGLWGAEPEDEMAAALQLGVQWGKPNYPTLSISNLTGAQIERALRFLEVNGGRGVCLWRMGTANAEHLRAFGTFAPNGTPPPVEPEPLPVDEIRRLVREARERLAQVDELLA